MALTTNPVCPDRATGSSRCAETSAPARLAWALVFVICTTLLALSAWLKPDPKGLGTHQQLGLAACGWMTTAALPCPTCGMTTAFSLTVHGHWWQGLKTQPAGAILTWLCGMGFWLGLLGTFSRANLWIWLAPLVRWRVGIAGFLVVSASWLYKIAVVRGF